MENEIFETEFVKCNDFMSLLYKMENANKCVARSSFLQKGDNGAKCCFYSFKTDPIIDYKKKYGKNWKKIVAQSKGYDLNISEKEIRQKLIENIKDGSLCQLTPDSSNTTFLYLYSLGSLNGTVKYNCGEGIKIFNRKEYHPTTRDQIIDKELLESVLSYSEKDCLKRGTKLSGDDYQLCWCEKIPLSAGGFNEKLCVPFRTSTFLTSLKREMNKSQKDNSKVEYKCTCSNNKKKTIKGRYNSANGEVKVE
jgi:hypothetical protein